MRKIFLFQIIAAVLSILISGCDSRPSHVLSRSKMEKVLYDYYIAQAMVTRLESDQKYMEQEYMDAVFENNGISKADFDTSMVWYTRNTEELKKIYDNLKVRLDEECEEMQMQTGSNEMSLMISENGDTANIWNGSNIILLRDNPLLNKESYIINADTSFRRHDSFVMITDINLFSENADMHDCYLTVSLSVRYKNDKIISSVRQFNYSGRQKLTINAVDDEDIKSVSGFFYYTGKKNARNFAAVTNMSLYRMHSSSQAEASDTTKVLGDSTKLEFKLAKDSIEDSKDKYLSPEELRKKNQGEKTINIRTAPQKVRPNRDFQRRRQPANGR